MFSLQFGELRTKIIDEIEKKLEQNGGQDADRDDAFGDMIRKSDRE